MENTSRILLVDDVPMFQELGQVFLSRSGPVDLADTASSAFQAADERRPTIVIADMHLPDMSGAELCRRFKTHPTWGAPRVVLLARPDAPEDHADAVRGGADDVLFKPLERDNLIACVRRLTEFDMPRGLPRARIDQPIGITARGRQFSGNLRNVSRGGVCLDAPVAVTHSEEVGLQFSLGREDSVVAPTAQVVWSRPSRQGPGQIGLRFLEIDAQTIEKLDRYISDHYPRTQSTRA